MYDHWPPPFATRLSRNGVASPTTQAALRHSYLDLTMNVYADPSLLDVAGLMDALPALGLSAEAEAGSGRCAQACAFARRPPIR